MIITFTAEVGKVINAEYYLNIVKLGLAKANTFYEGNLRWCPENGLVVKQANSVRMRLDGQLYVHNKLKRGASLVDGARLEVASIAANARVIDAIHELAPTAMIQSGNVFYQAQVPRPTKKATTPATPVTPASPAVQATIGGLLSKPDAPTAAPAAVSSGKYVMPPELPKEQPSKPYTETEIQDYYDRIYGGGVWGY